MSDQTAISWCDSTFNPWMGCTKVSPACDHCYAEALMDKRWGKVQWGAGQPRQRTSAANWRQPLLWERQHEAFALAHDGRRRRVFCASLADVFDNEVVPDWRWDLFRVISATPHLEWLLLTKRIGNARAMLNSAAAAVAGEFVGAAEWDRMQWPNIWLGATVVTQEEADRDIPKLLAVPAAKRFVSIEPMLGPVTLYDNWLYGVGWEHKPLDWIIAGGESGPQARPMHPDWVRALRDQCAEAGVPFHFKQWGEHAPNWLNDDAGQKIAGSEWIDRMGTKAAGRLLDGVEHNGFPA